MAGHSGWSDVRSRTRCGHWHLLECPYCGESFETPVDASSGSARYVEDCQICCQPIEFNLEVDHAAACLLNRVMQYGRLLLDLFATQTRVPRGYLAISADVTRRCWAP